MTQTFVIVTARNAQGNTVILGWEVLINDKAEDVNDRMLIIDMNFEMLAQKSVYFRSDQIFNNPGMMIANSPTLQEKIELYAFCGFLTHLKMVTKDN